MGHKSVLNNCKTRCVSSHNFRSDSDQIDKQSETYFNNLNKSDPRRQELFLQVLRHCFRSSLPKAVQPEETFNPAFILACAPFLSYVEWNITPGSVGLFLNVIRHRGWTGWSRQPRESDERFLAWIYRPQQAQNLLSGAVVGSCPFRPRASHRNPKLWFHPTLPGQ